MVQVLPRLRCTVLPLAPLRLSVFLAFASLLPSLPSSPATESKYRSAPRAGSVATHIAPAAPAARNVRVRIMAILRKRSRGRGALQGTLNFGPCIDDKSCTPATINAVLAARYQSRTGATCEHVGQHWLCTLNHEKARRRRTSTELRRGATRGVGAESVGATRKGDCFRQDVFVT